MKKYILIGLVILSPILMFAQQDPMVSQYMFAGLVLNPAYAGSHKYATATALYRKQWVNFEGSPSTRILSLEGPLKKRKVGLGVLLSHDEIGVVKQTDFYANYAYHIDLGEATLSMGLRGGGTFYSANLTALRVWDSNDPGFSQNIRSEFMPNFGAGMYLYRKNFFTGISVPHIINYDPATTFYLKKTDATNLIRHYYLNAGYIFNTKKDIILKPSILLKYVSSAIQADLNLNILFHKTFGIGVSYRTRDSFIAMLDLRAAKNFRIGYAYDFPMNDLKTYNKGSHEIMVAFDFGSEIQNMPRYRF
jgi:type IX secretion system PorP/SprF family membrane protein